MGGIAECLSCVAVAFLNPVSAYDCILNSDEAVAGKPWAGKSGYLEASVAVPNLRAKTSKR
jgi:hypothetical protein